ncbi:hypothetical protein [Solibacillus isronensis]|uniref:hypothetical protein n=1 Tax=Solibacillus isronensis TaxID=412383 RepID=UPI0020402262|nr:hypothetical protein [Solibacillus isronensis]MCM3722704.1 hypothetical protein [Solibacillus isronensis]
MAESCHGFFSVYEWRIKIKVANISGRGEYYFKVAIFSLKVENTEAVVANTKEEAAIITLKVVNKVKHD